jgi:hypothetical protein
MRRRHVITLFGGAVAAWPLAVLAQPTIPVVGFLHSGSAAPNAHLASAGPRAGMIFCTRWQPISLVAASL